MTAQRRSVLLVLAAVLLKDSRPRVNDSEN